MELIPIKQTFEENDELAINSLYQETIYLTIDFYKKVGFVPPWIGYFVKQDDSFVGNAGFKGPPTNGTVEIAYGTMEEYRKQGIGTSICKQLVDLSLKTDSSIKITARTLSKENFSASILEKNNFICTGTVLDAEDGEVWEWVFTAKE